MCDAQLRPPSPNKLWMLRRQGEAKNFVPRVSIRAIPLTRFCLSRCPVATARQPFLGKNAVATALAFVATAACRVNPSCRDKRFRLSRQQDQTATESVPPAAPRSVPAPGAHLMQARYFSLRWRHGIRSHCRSQSGCVVGDRPDLLSLAAAGEDSGDGAGRETDGLSVRCDG